jgi:hypothetical protein
MNDGRRGSTRLVFGGAAASVAILTAIGCSSAPPPDTGGISGTNGNGTSGASSGGPGAGGTPAGAGRGGIGVTGGAGGSIAPPVGGGGMGGGTQGCAQSTEKAQLLPLDLYVITDSSKSMLEMTSGGSTKWDALKGAMSGFFGDPGGEGLSVALKFFPDEEPNVPATCTDDAACGDFGPCDQRKGCVTDGTFSTQITRLCSTDADCPPLLPADPPEVCAPVQRCQDGANCMKVYCVSSGTDTPCPADCVPFDNYCRSRDVCTAASYGTPVVPMTTLPAGAQALTEALNARMPDGFTPTGPALTGAIQFAQAHQTANPTHKVAIVLVTDGMPGGFIPNSPPPACTPGDVMGVSTLVQTGSMGTPPIPTFVIGVFGPCDVVDQNIKPQENLDSWAASGGTSKAILIRTDGDVVAELKKALTDIRTSAIKCRYETPKPGEATVDYGLVNVTFTAAPSMPATTLNYVTNAAGCDPTAGGWYYDVDPKTGAKPTEIITCDQSCTAFQSAGNESVVNVVYGCPSQEPH